MLNTLTFELLGPIKYELIEIIEQTKNKTISKVIDKETKQKYCMIRFNRNIGISEKLTDFEINEIRILSTLPYHENLIHCYDIIIEDEFYYLIVDYFEKKTLHQLIIKNNSPFEENLIWEFLIQMLYSIYPLHMNNIIHHNIKNGNFYLYDNNKIKLGGFNLCEYQKESLLKDLYSSLNYFYSPPEIINKQSYESNCDIWSIGMCIYEMCFSSCDFCQVDIYSNILKGKINQINNEIYSFELYEIISLMLKNNKLSRPNITQILNNPIILNHIYNPMKYLDILSFGNGWIEEKIPFLEDLDLRNYLKEKISIKEIKNQNNKNINNNMINKEKRKSIKSMQIGKNELLIKTGLDLGNISLNNNNLIINYDNNNYNNDENKSIINERCNSCKHLKKIKYIEKNKITEKKDENLLINKLKSKNSNIKINSPRNSSNNLRKKNKNFSTSYPTGFYKKEIKNKNRNRNNNLIYTNLINDIFEKDDYKNLIKHSSFNNTNYQNKEKNQKNRSSMKLKK